MRSGTVFAMGGGMHAVSQRSRVVITGAGSGIGRAAAALFAEKGAQVAVLERTEAHGREVFEELGGAGEGHLLLAADAGDPSAMEAAFASIAAVWGGLDHVVANAGINGVWAPLCDITPEEWDATMTVNLRGAFLTLKYGIPLLAAGGSVVVVSSINGTRIFSNCGASAYAASKAAQTALAKMVALEFAPRGIRVNIVSPGSVATGIGSSMTTRDLESIRAPVIFPAGDVPLTAGAPARPEDVAAAIVFLCSPAAGHISGAELTVDGAQSLLQG